MEEIPVWILISFSRVILYMTDFGVRPLMMGHKSRCHVIFAKSNVGYFSYQLKMYVEISINWG